METGSCLTHTPPPHFLPRPHQINALILQLSASLCFYFCGQLGSLRPRHYIPPKRDRCRKDSGRSWLEYPARWSTRQRLKVLKRDYYFTCCVASKLLCHRELATGSGYWELVKGSYDIVMANWSLGNRVWHFVFQLDIIESSSNKSLNYY